MPAHYALSDAFIVLITIFAGNALRENGQNLLALAMAPILQAQTVLTVRDAEYRSRWAGKQEDRIVTPQYFAPGGGLDEEAAGATSTEDPTEPSLVESMDRMAENVKRGLRFGPLEDEAMCFEKAHKASTKAEADALLEAAE